MLERIKEVFEKSGKTQTEIAKLLDVTPQYIWKLLNQQSSEPSERIILSVLKAFPDINETWLRTGTGEMKAPPSREAEIAKITAQMFKAEETDFRYQLQKLISEMTEDEIELLKNAAIKLADSIK